MKRKDDTSLDLGRFSEPALHVLISLADGPKHGYALTEDIAALSGKRPGPGTHYGALTRLEQAGLIERLESSDRRPGNRTWEARQVSPREPPMYQRSSSRR